MKKIIYEGDINPCMVKRMMWGKGEIKEVEDNLADILLKNPAFSLVVKVKKEKVEKKVEVKEDKLEEFYMEDE